MWTRIYQAEPILVLLFGNAGLWTAVFTLMSAFGHPLTDSQQHAIIGLAVVVSALIARGSVASQATVQKQVAEQKYASSLPPTIGA